MSYNSEFYISSNLGSKETFAVPAGVHTPVLDRESVMWTVAVLVPMVEYVILNDWVEGAGAVGTLVPVQEYV